MTKIKIGSHPYLFPMPVVLIGSIFHGKPNYMPAAFVGIVNYTPAMIGCGLNPSHATSKGIEENKQFSVNIPSKNLMVPTDYCGLYSGKKIDKSDVFKTYFGINPKTPLIEECSIGLECELDKSIPLGNDTLYIGKIVEIHCDMQVMTDNQPDILKIQPFLFTFPNNGYYSIGERIGTGWKSGKDYNSNLKKIS